MKFYNRTTELEILERVKTQSLLQSRMTIITGRRRIGKTRTVTGRFTEFEGTLETENEDFDGGIVNFSAAIASITTNNTQRDTHLKSDDFFNAEQFPQLTFRNGKLTKQNDSNYTLIGDLTIRDVMKTIEMKVEYFGIMVDPYGNTKAGFEIAGEINRKEFNLSWSAVTEAGGIVVSDAVKLHINVQVVKQ